MRILDRDNIKVGLRDLGFGDEDWKRFSALIKRPNGILLVTGPTGSGKTTTLYAALNELNRPDVKIITAEDPVEYYLPGVNQCEVKAKIGMTFARIIRAMLRQNPNILLVGEIRDEETAEHRDSGVSDRTLGFQYAAHERCAQCCNETGRYRRPAVPGRQLGHGDHGPAARPQSLPQVPAAVSSPRPTSCQALGPPSRDRQEGQLHEGQGVHQLQQVGLSGPDGHLRADDHDEPDPRDDVQGGVRPRSSARWPASRGCAPSSRTG